MGVFNHTSYLDSIILMWMFAPSGVALDFNASLPLVGTCIRAFQNIYVPRSAHGSAARRASSHNGKQSPSISDLIAHRPVPTRKNTFSAL